MAAGSVDPAALNAAVWRRGAWVAAYDNERLSRAEIRLLLHDSGPLAGRVLELGPGAGRVTTYLADLATELTALELSPAMAEACRRRVPSARVEVRDMTDLGDFGDGAFDAVVAGNNVIDVLDDPDRRALLVQLRRILTPGGALQFSSHNRDHDGRRPWQPRDLRNPRWLAGDLLRLPASVRNHRRLAPEQREYEGYAVRNDEAHSFSLLLYHITARGQREQLAEAGFTLELCLTEAGDVVDVDGPPNSTPYLHYSARASADRPGTGPSQPHPAPTGQP
jgi:SAM-dependent methyltransferase